MNFKTSRLFTLISFLLITGFASADLSSCKENFLNTPKSSQPHTWWHWMNGNVTKAGITADLEAMADVGIGGAQIFNVGDRSSVDIPVGPVDYMSEQWLELVHHAVKEADRLGIEICMHNCAGWSSSGGPWITPEFAMKKVTFSEYQLRGPGLSTIRLPEPPKVRDYYQPISVVAFPTPANNTYRIPRSQVKAGFQSSYGVDLESNPAPAEAIIDSNTIIDISSKVDSTGTLKWNCPAGNWTILRIGYTITGKNNHPAPDSGFGLECDKLSRAAMDIHWQHGIKPILDKLGDLVGPVMNNLLIDSYEVGLNNWTKGFASEFKRRRGYSLDKYLPTIAGRVVDDLAISERFLWDYRRTLSDMFTENYFNYFAQKCHEAGLLCSSEPYDGPFECLSIASQADILMGEFWIGGGMNQSVRIASSVAHVYGRKIIGAESFTSSPENGRWQNHPRSMKALGDSMWCNGINRYIFHRYAHQPWLDQYPGMTMGQWGTHFERTNTWWNDGREWMDYIARSQYLLQSGSFHADILFFGGEFVPNGAVYRPEVKAMGYDYDAIGTDLLSALSVENGKLLLPSGMRYSILVMPNTSTMSLAVAKKIQQLINDGATIIASYPKRTPSLVDFPHSQQQLESIASDLWPSTGKVDRKIGRGRLLSGYSLQQALELANIKPDFEVKNQNANLNFIHRIIDGADFYFVSNQKNETVTTDCVFNVSGRQPEIWSSQYAVAAPVALWSPSSNRTLVNLTLQPEESVFVVFDKPNETDETTCVSVQRQGGSPQPVLQNEIKKIEIVSAQYGAFSFKQIGLVDVTDIIKSKVKDNCLDIFVNNTIGGDPSPNVQKTMQIVYTYDNKEYQTRFNESTVAHLPLSNFPAGKELIIKQAFYGDLPAGLTRLPKLKTADITAELKERMVKNILHTRIDNSLVASDPVPNVSKQAKIIYTIDGLARTVYVDENQSITIPPDPWSPVIWPAELVISNDKPRLKVWDDGDYHIKKSDGSESLVSVAAMPEPVKISGPWSVCFKTPLKTPAPATFDKLISLSDSTSPDIKGFSGTTTYETSFDVSRNMIKSDHQLTLDLGRVEVIAHVFVNGKDLGIYWKDPYRLDISKVVHPGKNTLKVKVANLWVNRIIADQAYIEDCHWKGKALAQWPDWFVNKTPRPTPRQTFYTWQHWSSDDPLMISGLIGPVYLRTAQFYDVK